mgnify:CR=1 FL=1
MSKSIFTDISKISKANTNISVSQSNVNRLPQPNNRNTIQRSRINNPNISLINSKGKNSILLLILYPNELLLER